MCSPLLEGASDFLPDRRRHGLQEVRDNLLAFAECLREQGVDVDDPTFGNGFTAEAIFGGSFDDPANADAIAECQGVFGAVGRWEAVGDADPYPPPSADANRSGASFGVEAEIPAASLSPQRHLRSSVGSGGG